jgi:hypothetical protein
MWWRLFQTIVAIATGWALIYSGAELDGRALGIAAIIAAFTATVAVTYLARGVALMRRRTRRRVAPVTRG